MSVKKALKDAKRRTRRKSRALHKSSGATFSNLNNDESKKSGPWFGYESSLSAQLHSDEKPTVLSMVNEINLENYSYFQDKFPNRFVLGDWFVSAGTCANLVVSGPFDSMQEAFNYSTQVFGTEYYKFEGW